MDEEIPITAKRISRSKFEEILEERLVELSTEYSELARIHNEYQRAKKRYRVRCYILKEDDSIFYHKAGRKKKIGF